MTRQRILTSIAALALAAACGSDTVTSPIFGSGCNVGSIAPGETKEGRLTQASCTTPYHFYSSGAPTYESYTVRLERGKGYMFNETHLPDTAAAGIDDVDPMLTLWGILPNGTSIPLGISDDEAGTLNSSLYFIAPVSGTFQLVAASFWGGEFGAYRLTAAECPVIAALDTAGTYSLALRTSPCIKTKAGNALADTSAYVLLSADVEPFEQLNISANSAAFTPVWEAFGAGFDTYAHVYPGSRDTLGIGNGVAGSFLMDSLGGPVTIAIGGTAAQTSGAFTLILGRAFPAPPPAIARHWSIAGLAQSALRPRTTKTH